MGRLEEILAREPGVGALLEEARGNTDEWALAYPAYKARLGRLVGWGAEREELRDARAYETALDALCGALEQGQDG